MKAFHSLHRRNQGGVALVVVIWAFGLIFTALVGFSVLLQRQLGQEIASLQNSRATLLAESGIQMSLNPQLAPWEMAEASSQIASRLKSGWRISPLDDFNLTVEMQEEDGRLNVNALRLSDQPDESQRILVNLLVKLELESSAASALAEDMLASEQSGLRPWESLRPMEDLPSWELVPEEKREPIRAKLRSLFTVYGSGKLSLKAADPSVLEAVLVPPASSQGLQQFLKIRPGPDLIPGTADDIVNPGLLGSTAEITSVLAQRTSANGGDSWRVTSTGTVGKATRTVEAVISRNPPMVKARWVEEKPAEKAQK